MASSSQHYSCTHILLLLLSLHRGRQLKDPLYVFVRAAVHSSTLTTHSLLDIEYHIKFQCVVKQLHSQGEPGKPGIPGDEGNIGPEVRWMDLWTVLQHSV